MENKIEIKRDLAHVDYESGRYQTMKEHSENVANYAAETCSLSELKILVSPLVLSVCIFLYSVFYFVYFHYTPSCSFCQ